jgi:ABC-2 type transport system ATP-binding protein
MSVIDIKNVTKYYGKVCALNNISTRIESNKIYGLLGRNGAGKTTLLRLITNQLFPTSGEITIDSENVHENDNAIGKIYYMNEGNLYPENMKIKEVFKWTKEFYPSFDLPYAFELSKKFELKPDKKLKSLSTGYSSISKLITALASNAEIMMFDEPILGLDAYHRDLFYKELLNSYIKEPKTIILSTHIIEEIDDILERVIILKDASITVDDSVENLLSKAYVVSGLNENIDKYLQDKKFINIDEMASYKSATILGEVSQDDKVMAEKLKLEFSKVELQKIFIYLTKAGGVEQ